MTGRDYEDASVVVERLHRKVRTLIWMMGITVLLMLVIFALVLRVHERL